MKPLDGNERILSGIQNLKQRGLAQDSVAIGHIEIGELVKVLTLQAQAIDRLAASNEALVDAMMDQDEQDEDQPQRDMAGNLIRTS